MKSLSNDFCGIALPVSAGQMCAQARRVERQGRKLLAAKGLDDLCAVAVERDGDWYVFRGRVDSHRTRMALFNLVPKQNGASLVVDNLCVRWPQRAELTP